MTVTKDGEAVQIDWDDLGVPDTGWCKLDWIVADPARRALANASNVLDVTWEAPDGTITPLDKFIDPYFQEVYLEAESLPLFNRIVSQLSSDAVDTYVDDLEYEVHKYVTREKNFGKAARRMYNVFRLTGRYAEAAYLRELFDEPTTVLYQVAALIRTLDEADRPGAEFGNEMLLSQTDTLIISAVSALEGKSETDMVRALLAVRDNLAKAVGAEGRSGDVEQVRSGAIEAVNEYFERRLVGHAADQGVPRRPGAAPALVQPLSPRRRGAPRPRSGATAAFRARPRSSQTLRRGGTGRSCGRERRRRRGALRELRASPRRARRPRSGPRRLPRPTSSPRGCPASRTRRRWSTRPRSARLAGEPRQRLERVAEDVGADAAPHLVAVDEHPPLERGEVERSPVVHGGAQARSPR